jgi:hypothetical protein
MSPTSPNSIGVWGYGSVGVKNGNGGKWVEIDGNSTGDIASSTFPKF